MLHTNMCASLPAFSGPVRLLSIYNAPASYRRRHNALRRLATAYRGILLELSVRRLPPQYHLCHRLTSSTGVAKIGGLNTAWCILGGRAYGTRRIPVLCIVC